MNIESISVKKVERDILKESLKIPVTDNSLLEIRNFCVYEDAFCIDNDCVFWEIENKYFEGKVQKVISIPCWLHIVDSNGFQSTHYYSDFSADISLEAYLKMAERINLTDFIRYNYNPRIISNQRLLLKFISELKSSE
jgi:hypothetical protein